MPPVSGDLTPAFPLVKAEYLRRGINQVEGWLNLSTAIYLSGLEVLQRGIGPAGDVCEIGIHHGKSFLCLALGLPAGERAVAVDLFPDPADNVDGRDKRAIFEHNAARHGAAPPEVVRTSSLELERLGFVDKGRRFRIFSIDGAHTIEITLNDLAVAERTVLEGGLVVLDDVLNPHWLAVITALFQYWSDGGTLVPAVLVPNKLILATSPESAAIWRKLMRGAFGAGLTKADVALGQHQIDVYGNHTWVVADEMGGTGQVAQPPLGRRVGRALARRMPRLARRVRALRRR